MIARISGVTIVNLNRTIVVSIVLISGLLVATAGSFAGKPDRCSPWPACKDDSGDPPPPPPPTNCADDFPWFLYQVEATRKTQAELHLASTDGCRSELVAILPHLRGSVFRMTTDGSKGVILWTEDIDNQYIVRRLDFTVDNSGNLALGNPVTVLPLAGEEAISDHHLFYFSPDIWGDATHGSLYLTILRINSIHSGDEAGGGTTDALIYDLNDLTGDLAGPAPATRLIFHEQHAFNEVNYGTWFDAGDPADLPDCSTVAYPQFVATCYRAEELRFNPSGTRLYVARNVRDRDDQRWDGTSRIHIDRLDTMGEQLPLDQWILTCPELIYAGSGDQTASGMLARPADDPYIPPSTEFIAIRHTDRTGKNVLRTGDILNADLCASEYEDYVGGNLDAGNYLWQVCLDTGVFFAAYNHGGGDSWQSPEALLTSTLNNRSYDIYRRYVTGPYAGTEQLLIETGRGADNGF